MTDYGAEARRLRAARVADVKRMRAEGATIRAIAATLNVDAKTVQGDLGGPGASTGVEMNEWLRSEAKRAGDRQEARGADNLAWSREDRRTAATEATARLAADPNAGSTP